MGIIVFILLEIPYFLRDKFKEYGEKVILLSSISPITGVDLVLY